MAWFNDFCSSRCFLSSRVCFEATLALLHGLPWWLRWWRNSLQWGRPRFNAWARKIPWRREWLSTSAFLAGESHRQSSLAGHCAWGCKESDTTEKLTLSLSHFCIDLKLIYSGLSKGSLSSLWHVVLSHFSHIQLFKWHYSMTQPLLRLLSSAHGVTKRFHLLIDFS